MNDCPTGKCSVGLTGGVANTFSSRGLCKSGELDSRCRAMARLDAVWNGGYGLPSKGENILIRDSTAKPSQPIPVDQINSKQTVLIDQNRQDISVHRGGLGFFR